MALHLASLLTVAIAFVSVDSARKRRHDRAGGASVRRQASSHANAFGVNYGNRFLPEKWMWDDEPFFWNGVYAQGREPGADHTRLSLPDLGESRFRERMMQWLDMTVIESDFVKMQQMGVEVIRVPCGYWNWISYAPGQGPNAPGNESARMTVLTTLPPASYRPYFDKIFQWAARYGMRIWLDLHGLPGSQNGAEHSGICVETPHWNTDWNIQKSIEAVSAMAEYCADKGSTLYGLQVMNEPNNFDYDIRATLDTYYDRAIREARNHLAWNVPIILFEWTYNMYKWPSDRYSESRYGTVVWDTHIYTVWQVTYDVEATQNVYWEDLSRLESFNSRQSGGAIVGEWALAGTEYDSRYGSQKAEAYRNLSSWAVWVLMERSNGAIYWNWDANITQWSYERSQNEFGIDWKNMPKPQSPSGPGGGCCKFGADCGDCGNDGSGWCHAQSFNCDACGGSWDASSPRPSCR